MAGLAAATSRVVNTFEPMARSDQFKEVLNRVYEHRGHSGLSRLSGKH